MDGLIKTQDESLIIKHKPKEVEEVEQPVKIGKISSDAKKTGSSIKCEGLCLGKYFHSSFNILFDFKLA